MNMIYNSPHFCVVEFAPQHAPSDAAGSVGATGGFEIMGKTLRREIFLRGQDAEVFRASVQALIDREPTADEVDEFLNRYSGLMTQPLTLH
jgi:transcriptional regulator of nitric oxide reductase